MLELCVATAPKAWLAGTPRLLGPPSCCGPPQAALGPTGSSKAGTTCQCDMPGTSMVLHPAVDGMISGYDYDYDYIYIYVRKPGGGGSLMVLMDFC